MSQFQKSVTFEIGFAFAPEYWRRIPCISKKCYEICEKLMKLFQKSSDF